MEEGSSTSATFLPDDVIVDILSRLPAKSLSLCKCVSRSWRGLISDPTHRRRLAQTLAGLFFLFHRPYDTRPPYGFTSFTSPSPPVDPALLFLPPSFRDIELLDCCNGLFLLRCSHTPLSQRHRANYTGPPPPPPFYVVCNPATREWVALPQPSYAPGEYGGGCKNTMSAALGFDPAVSPHFHVFQLVEEEVQYNFLVDAVEIYSSETGKWDLKESRWDESRWILFAGNTTYFDGFLHFAILNHAVASVDTKGQTWRVTDVRRGVDYGSSSHGFVGHSQGHLLYVDDDVRGDDLSIYVLEDQDSVEWTLKSSVSKLDLFGPGKPNRGHNYCVAAFHPNCNVVFLYDWSRKRLMSYDMNYRDVHFICTLRKVSSCNHRPFLPYVPLYSRALALPNVK